MTAIKRMEKSLDEYAKHPELFKKYRTPFIRSYISGAFVMSVHLDSVSKYDGIAHIMPTFGDALRANEDPSKKEIDNWISVATELPAYKLTSKDWWTLALLVGSKYKGDGRADIVKMLHQKAVDAKSKDALASAVN